MKIVVLDGYTLNPGDNPWTAIEKLGDFIGYDRTENNWIAGRIKDADVVLTNKTPLNAETIEKASALKYISVLATGFNIVDIEAARRKNIPVSNVPVYGTDSVAQYTFALLLELCHHIGLHDRAVKKLEWTKGRDFCFWKTPLVELAGKTMGLVGFGRIGRRVARIADAFGMKVIAYDEYRGNTPDFADFKWVELKELFSEADVISLHCPQTKANTGFVNRALTGLMKPEALFINTARGGLVNEADLAEALNCGRLAGAAVDVVASEPVKADNPLLRAKNCLITPHIAWATLAARKRLTAVTAENIAAFSKGSPINVVNGI